MKVTRLVRYGLWRPETKDKLFYCDPACVSGFDSRTLVLAAAAVGALPAPKPN
jgi:hypothetical protein